MPPNLSTDPTSRTGNVAHEELSLDKAARAEVGDAVQALFDRKSSEIIYDDAKVSRTASGEVNPRPFEYIMRQTGAFVETIKGGGLTFRGVGEEEETVLFEHESNGQKYDVLQILPREFFNDVPTSDGHSERKEPISVIRDIKELLIRGEDFKAKILAEEFLKIVETKTSAIVERSIRNSIGNRVGRVVTKETTTATEIDPDSEVVSKLKIEKPNPADYDNEDDFARALYPEKYQKFDEANIDPNDPLSEIFKPSPLYTGEVQLTPGQLHEFRVAQKRKERVPKMEEQASMLAERILMQSKEQGLSSIAAEMRIVPSDFSEQLRENSEVEKRVRNYFTDRLTKMTEEQRTLVRTTGLQKIARPSKVLLKQLLPERVIDNSAGNIKKDPYSGSRLKSRDMVVEYAMRMLDGRWDNLSESSDESYAYYRDGNGEEYEVAVTGQHRQAAKILLHL